MNFNPEKAYQEIFANNTTSPGARGVKPSKIEVIDIFDTHIIEPAETLDEFTLFNQDANAYSVGNLNDLRAKYDGLAIFAGHVDFELTFAQTNSEAVGSLMKYFLDNSYLTYKIGTETQPDIRFADMHDIKYRFDGSAYNEYMKDGAGMYQFPVPVLVPKGGNVKMVGDYASGLTTPTSGATTPLFPGAGLTDNKGYAVYYRFKALAFEA